MLDPKKIRENFDEINSILTKRNFMIDKKKFESIDNNRKNIIADTESLQNKKKCSIVLVSSIYGLVGQDISIYAGTNLKENISYSIIKGGIISLTKQMSSYYSKFGIRINNVCQGGVYDEQMKKKSFWDLIDFPL